MTESTEQNRAAASPGELTPVKRALAEMREMRERLEAMENERSEPIAIVGMDLRFPGGANDPEAFWNLLAGGGNAVGEIPPDRWNIDDYFDENADAPGKMYTRHGGFLDRVDLFDAGFFGISPREAETMDPQQRILLEVSWSALERAGQSPEKLNGRAAGVFFGVSSNDYFRKVFDDPSNLDAWASTGNAFSVAAGRVAYLLGLRGPAMAVDTACSSSLVAVHLACQSLRARECELALAGGVNLILSPEFNINFCKAGMLARDGRCKTFDAAADGYVRSEGCGVVVLKRLGDALASRDRILAVIRGSAVNQDGRSSGLTAPNGPAQEAVIREALRRGGVEPDRVQYIEAHGTGTSLGDPIEVHALASVFAGAHDEANPLWVGSVKTNLGHLEAAAGIAGLIKTALALRHGVIPPHLHFEKPNPHIRWEGLPFRIPTAPQPWKKNDQPRVAGVSSFGFSGTNAHVVLEEAPAIEAPAKSFRRSLHLLAISAKSETALKEAARSYSDHLRTRSADFLEDVCYTANAGRAHFAHRAAIIGADRRQMEKGLQEFLAGHSGPYVHRGASLEPHPPDIAFLFTGQGAQHPGMGQRLYETQPAFRRALERCDAWARKNLDWSLLDMLFEESGDDARIHETAFTQPAVFAFEAALAEMWRSWGVEPSAVAGHSLGEYAAACAAGVFSLEDGLHLTAERGRLVQALPRDGMMAAVFAPEAEVAEALSEMQSAVAIAAVNGPENVVVSGRREDVEIVLARFEAKNVRHRALKISHAFHSPLIESALREFENVFRAVEFREPRMDVISNVTGQPIDADEIASAQYWLDHARRPVRFADSVRRLFDSGCRLFLEIGPHPVLTALVMQNVEAPDLACLSSLHRERDAWETLLEALAALYVRGVRVDWEGFDEGFSRRKVELPPYPFQRRRYWIETKNRGAPLQRIEPATRWRKIEMALARQSEQAPLGMNFEGFAKKWEVLEEVATVAIIGALRELGVFAEAGERLSVEALIERCGIDPKHGRLLRRWLERLVEAGHLAREGGEFVCRGALPQRDLDEPLRLAKNAFADYPEMFDYVAHCASKLAAVLTGRESPLETLFPDGRFDLAEGLYERSCVARYINAVARAAVEAYAQTASGPLRVLEIGAGTGGTTAALLPALEGADVEYHFTDLSPLFLNHAEAKFKDHPFMRYRLFDIERDPAEQGFAPHAFDIVIASNVIHAARDLVSALARVRSLLASGGMLLLSETTRHQPWFDITTGLIEGWQAFEDDRRGDHPLLDAAQWLDLLDHAGFECAIARPDAASPAGVLGNHVIVARGPAVEASLRDPQTPQQSEGDRPADAPMRFAPGGEADGALRKEIEAMHPTQRRERLIDFVRDEVVCVLRLEADRRPDRRSRLMDLGFDSLMAVQLRNRLASGLALDRKLPATLVFDFPTIEAVADMLEEKFFAHGEESKPETNFKKTPKPRPRVTEKELQHMSDEEVEAMLLERAEPKPDKRS